MATHVRRRHHDISAHEAILRSDRGEIRLLRRNFIFASTELFMKHAAELFKICDEGERDMLAIGTCQGPSIPPLRWTVCCVTHLHRDHQNHVRSPVRCLRGHRPAERRTPAHPDSDMRFPIPHAVEWLATATTKNPWPGAFFSLARSCLSTIVQCCAKSDVWGLDVLSPRVARCPPTTYLLCRTDLSSHPPPHTLESSRDWQRISLYLKQS